MEPESNTTRALRRSLAALGLVAGIAVAPAARGADAPTGALIYCGADGCATSTSALVATLEQAGARPVDVVDVTSTLPPLDPYRVVFVLDPRDGIAPQAAALEAFRAAGGTLVLAGECERWAGEANTTIDDLLSALGSSLQIVTDSKYPDASCTMYEAQTSSAPLMTGVDGLQFAWASTISGPAADALATYGSDVIVAADLDARVIVSGDASVFFGCTSGTPENETFFTNVWTAAADGFGGASGSGTGGTGSGSGAGSDGAASAPGGCEAGGGALGLVLPILALAFAASRRGRGQTSSM